MRYPSARVLFLFSLEKLIKPVVQDRFGSYFFFIRKQKTEPSGEKRENNN